MKPMLMTWQKLVTNPIIYSVLLRILTFVSYTELTNRMRNIHVLIETEFGENISPF